MTTIPFIKMQGAGNDFIVLDALAHPLPHDFDYSAAAQAWCARHTGIGSDGLLLLDAPAATAATQGATMRMRMWNPDGSEDMCGNGLRCVAHLAHQRGYAGATFKAQTRAGLRHVEILKSGSIRISMGYPDFNPATIPFQPDDRQLSSLDYVLPLDHVLLPHVTTLSTGSTHTVIFSEALPEDAFFTQLSPLIENHPWFPERASVMWCQVVNPHHLKLCIWERGAGETLACGTGACAAAVAAQVTGRCQAGIDVQSRGGTLHIEWQPGQEIRMTGPARIVCAGRMPALAAR